MRGLAFVAFLFGGMWFAEWFGDNAPFWLGLLVTVGFFALILWAVAKVINYWGKSWK